MSLIRPILNHWLRWTEKPHMARASPEKLRRSLELKARLFFHAPFGTRFSWTQLNVAGHEIKALKTSAKGAGEGPLILYVHGGGFIFGSPRTHKAMLGWLSHYTGLPACLPEYRLAPEHPFPAAIDDVVLAYQAVMDHPGGVILGGDSAGGALVLTLLGEILRQGLPQPLGCFAFSPLTDLTFSGASLTENADSDVELPAERVGNITQGYLAGADPADPRVSPLQADFKGAPPVWLVVGSTEILRDDTIRMAARLHAQGVDVTHKIEHDLPHVWPLFQPLLPEAGKTLRELADWITALPSRSGGN